MNINCRYVLYFVAGIICVVLTSDIVSAEEPTALREIPTVHLNIFQTSTSITAPIDGEITLTNLTNKAYDVQFVKLQIPQGLSAIRPKFSELINKEIHEIGGKDEKIYSISIPRATMTILNSITNSETLLFIPGKYRVRAEVVLKESGNDKGIRSLYSSTEISLEPPLSAVLRGGVMGALLLALFVPAYRALHSRRSEGEANKITIANSVAQFFIYSISGSVVAVTTILFIHRMGSANLPISISVNDYLGGIIIGLFSYVFGDTLYKKFFGIK
jgi:hypothetical protein